MKKTVRGKWANGSQVKSRLSTNKCLTGYQVAKLTWFPDQPGTSTVENVGQLFTTKRTVAIPTSAATVTFDDPTLLGAAFYNGEAAGEYFLNVVFDNMKFNQDIFITHTNNQSGASVNFYLELEQVKLDVDEATVATLKDMRGRE